MKKYLVNSIQVGEYTFAAGTDVEVIDSAKFVISIKLTAIGINGGTEEVQAFVRPDELRDRLDDEMYFETTHTLRYCVAKRVNNGFIIVTHFADGKYSAITRKKCLNFSEEEGYKDFKESDADTFYKLYYTVLGCFEDEEEEELTEAKK